MFPQKNFHRKIFFQFFLAQTPLIYTFLLIFKLYIFNTEWIFRKKVKKIFKIGEKTFNSVFPINPSLILLNFELIFPYPPHYRIFAFYIPVSNWVIIELCVIFQSSNMKILEIGAKTKYSLISLSQFSLYFWLYTWFKVTKTSKRRKL